MDNRIRFGRTAGFHNRRNSKDDRVAQRPKCRLFGRRGSVKNETTANYLPAEASGKVRLSHVQNWDNSVGAADEDISSIERLDSAREALSEGRFDGFRTVILQLLSVLYVDVRMLIEGKRRSWPKYVFGIPL